MTGLAVVDTATQLSAKGQLLVLVLIVGDISVTSAMVEMFGGEPRQATVIAGPVRTGDDEPHMIGEGIF